MDIMPIGLNPLKSQGKLTSGFGIRFHPIDKILKMHYGSDIAAPTGTPIYATSQGIVIESLCKNIGYGCRIVLAHGNPKNKKPSFYTRYAHMVSQSPLKLRDVINKGDLIGYVGSTGKSTGPHLHYEILDNNKRPIDPQVN